MGMDSDLSDIEAEPLTSSEEEQGEAKTTEEQFKKECSSLSQTTFFLGLLNIFATTAIAFGKPQHLWLFYGVKSFVLIPIWWFEVTVRHAAFFWIFDFCWVANMIFGLYMLLSFLNAVPASLQGIMFLIFYSTALGPLAWACLILFNGMVLHSAEKIASIFIHLTPTIVTWTFMAYPEQIEQAWPGRFPGAAYITSKTFPEIYWAGFSFYLAWLLPYSIWLLSVGVYFPSWGFNTVFEDLYKKNKLKKVFNKCGLMHIRTHAFIYLIVHMLGVALSYTWPGFCVLNLGIHFGFGIFVIVSSSWWGAGYYGHLLGQRSIEAPANDQE